MDSRTLNILTIDDDPADAEILGRHLDDIPGITISLSHYLNADEGLAALKDSDTDVDFVFLDYYLGDKTGLQIVERVRASGDLRPIIVLTGRTDATLAVAITQAGADDYISKNNLSTETLRRAIDHAYARQHKRELATHNQQLVEELQTTNRLLEEKNNHLAQMYTTAHRFVDNVAHEFRTPLTVIKEFASIIVDGLGGPVTKTQTEYLQFITTATRDLAQLVDDFLDSSKLKAGSLRVDREFHSIREVFDSVKPILSTRASAKKIELTQQIDPRIGQVFVDLEKIGRIIVNLTVNAIKFSPDNSEIKLWAKPGDNDEITIGISDQGPGLSKDDVAVIFDRFKQVGDVHRSTTKGFGLGLNIARELIWLNLGTVHVESKVGSGSTFSFTLPPVRTSPILESYFDRLRELDSPPVKLSVLEIRPTQSATDCGEIRQFLASVCYPMDLAIPDVNGHSVIAIGATSEPDRWVRRLKTTRSAKIHNNLVETLSPLDIKCLGTWSFPQDTRPIESCLLDHIPELKNCA